MLGNTDLNHNKGHSPIFEIKKKELVYSYIFMCFLFFCLVF